MAADVLCSDNIISSPRISFSHDLNPTQSNPSESDPFLLNSTIDFDFSLHQNSSQHLSSADEIFADGKILPIQIKNPKTHKNPVDSNTNTKKKRLIEFLSTTFDEEEEQKTEQKTGQKPFWQFRSRSSLMRSNSTGSAPTQKAFAIPKAVLNKQHSLKEASICSAFDGYKNTPNRAYLKKSGSSKMYGNGVRVSPVLNIPPTYITKGTVGLFGIASLFCSKKSKKKKN